MSIKYNDKINSQEVLLAGVPATDQILSPTSKNSIANKTVFNALSAKVDKTVSDLINYYNKSDVYNKAEVRELISAIDTLTMEVVSSLPVSDISTTTIYLLKQSGSNVYDEYVYINNAWVKIGTTEMDLSNYVTSSQLTAAISDFLTETEINTLLAAKQDKQLSSQVTIGSQTIGTVEDAIDEVAGLIPTTASTLNLLAVKSDIPNVDSALSDSSTNPVQNKVVKAAVDARVFSNPNILDNAWFTVNQRNFSDTSGGGTDSYRFDRWRGTYGYNATDELPALTGVQYAIQRLEASVKNFLDRKVVTASVLYNDGTIETGYFTYYKQPTNWITVSTITRVHVQIGYNSNPSNILNGSFCITNKNVDLSIRAVKLELGSISTLATDTVPNYQQELAKCQGYFVRYTSPNNTCKPIGYGFMSSTTDARICIPLPAPMRATPSITFSDISKFRVYPTASSISDPSVIGLENNILDIKATTSNSMTQYQTCVFADCTQSEYIDISAEI